MPNRINANSKLKIIQTTLERKSNQYGTPSIPESNSSLYPRQKDLSEFTKFDKLPSYEKVVIPKIAASRMGLKNPFFITHDGIASATTTVNGEELINFSSYNYLGLSGQADVSNAAKLAIDRFGTSVSASRLVAGERPIQQQLESDIAAIYKAERCLTFVSGHATNVSTIGYLFGPKDLVVHDSLIHNSILEGIKLAGSTRRSFPHNDLEKLDLLLTEIRHRFERVLIVVEGHYSMDGDIPDLPMLIALKKKHYCFLMVDEAHSLGVIGETGKGIHEHFNINPGDVDIWMGTLSKTLAGCGGYIAGNHALIDNLRYAAPGFVYSVGISPPLAAAAICALKTMQQQPELVRQLRDNSQHFLASAKAAGLNTGMSLGFSIVPIIVGSSIHAVELSSRLQSENINVQPIIYPAVEEKSARLRFFISSLHTRDQIDKAINVLKKIML